MPGRKQKIRHTEDSIQAEIEVRIVKEGDYYVAHAAALEVSSYAKTAEKAKERFLEALDIFIEDTTEKGTLEKVLLDLGWTLQRKPEPKYTPPKVKRLRTLSPKAESIQQSIAIPY